MIVLHFTRELLHSFYSYNLLAEMAENNSFPLILMEDRKTDEKRIFFKTRGEKGRGWVANEATMFIISEREEIKSQIFVKGIQKKEDTTMETTL